MFNDSLKSAFGFSSGKSLRPWVRLRLGILTMLSLVAFVSFPKAEDSTWVKIWDKNPGDWSAYFAFKGIANPGPIFTQSPEGYLWVNITQPYSEVGFGHYFYTKRTFSHYLVRAEYKFTANDYGPGWGQGWNRQNNGLMLHSQDIKTMGSGQDFPNSIEVQLLGPFNEQNTELKSQGFKYATTANLCTPGTFVAYNGNSNYTTHCTAAQYPDKWKNTDIPWEAADGFSDVTVKVMGDSMEHYIHGEKVLSYGKTRLDDGKSLAEGFISVQAEGTSTLFRKIEVLDLVGCMDQANPNFRSYFVKNDAEACKKVVALNKNQNKNPTPPQFIQNGRRIRYNENLPGRIELFRMDGRPIFSMALTPNSEILIPSITSGLHMLRVTGPHSEFLKRILLD